MWPARWVSSCSLHASPLARRTSIVSGSRWPGASACVLVAHDDRRVSVVDVELGLGDRLVVPRRRVGERRRAAFRRGRGVRRGRSGLGVLELVARGGDRSPPPGVVPPRSCPGGPGVQCPWQTSASFQARLKASCRPLFMPWPWEGEQTWAASPASRMRPDAVPRRDLGVAVEARRVRDVVEARCGQVAAERDEASATRSESGELGRR